MIYIAPDRTGYTNLPKHIVSSELEPLTGADLMISDFPIEQLNESTLQAHIQAKALFVQIKIGYDVLNFDGLHNFCARVQKAQIPKNQAILLWVGEYWRDDDGLLRVKGNKPYGNTSWRDFRKAMIACELRGVTVFPEYLQSMDELFNWIEDYQAIINKISNEGKREIYPTRPTPQFQPEDIWQEIVEVSEDDWRYFLCAGLKGFGVTTANNVDDYLKDNLLSSTGYYALKALTDEDDKNKPIHNVKGWGDKSRSKLRALLQLPPGYNLAVRCNDDFDYVKGWHDFGMSFKQMIEDGHSAKDTFNALMKMAKEF